MKAFVTFLALVAVAAASDIQVSDAVSSLYDFAHLHGSVGVVPRNAINDRLRELLESFREVIANGDEENGIPVLDPLAVDKIDITIEERPVFRALVTLSDVDVRGLKDFIINNIEFRIIGLVVAFDITVPRIVYESDYSVDGRLLILIKFNPSGTALIVARDARISGAATLATQMDGSLSLRDLELNVDVGSTIINIQGLIENNIVTSLLNSVLTVVSGPFIQSQRERLSQFLTETLFETLNELIGRFNLSDIIG